MEEFYFTIMNAVIEKLQTNMENLHRNIVWFNLDQLKELYEKDFKSSVINFEMLVDRFDSIKYYEEFNLIGTMDRVEEYTSYIPRPSKEPLSSNPLRFWIDYNNYTNQLNSNQQRVFQLLKHYVVNAPDDIGQNDKKDLLDNISEVKKESIRVKALFDYRYRKYIDSSTILQKLIESR
jgi:hypothetical protein